MVVHGGEVVIGVKVVILVNNHVAPDARRARGVRYTRVRVVAPADPILYYSRLLTGLLWLKLMCFQIRTVWLPEEGCSNRFGRISRSLLDQQSSFVS